MLKGWRCLVHYAYVMMTKMAPQITSLTVVYSTVYSDADQIKHQSSASLAFVRGIHRGRTKGQLRGKCFHLMTSSCIVLSAMSPMVCISPWNVFHFDLSKNTLPSRGSSPASRISSSNIRYKYMASCAYGPKGSLWKIWSQFEGQIHAGQSRWLCSRCGI